VQALGGCGYRFLAKIEDGSREPTKVSVPNVDEYRSVSVLGVYHGHLELQASLSCGDGEALVDYDPTAGTSTVLLGPTVNGGGVRNALLDTHAAVNYSPDPGWGGPPGHRCAAGCSGVPTSAGRSTGCPVSRRHAT
jgi:hypothetical protein